MEPRWIPLREKPLMKIHRWIFRNLICRLMEPRAERTEAILLFEPEPGKISGWVLRKFS